MRSTSFSVRRRYSIRSATVTSLIPCRSQYGIRSGIRAIVPSSFMISQTTPAGFSPARRARSTAASVWPGAAAGRRRAWSAAGRRGPGWTSASAALLGSIATWIVCERSCAEMPVVTPSRASIETVKAVPYGVSLRSVICRSSSSSQRSSVRQRQISPRACMAMKLIASGVANWAAIVRSPSFSRSAASTTTTNLPWRMSSIASSTVAKGVLGLRRRRGGHPRLIVPVSPGRTSLSTYLASTSASRLTGSPAAASRGSSTSSVCGTSATAKPSASSAAIVRDDALDGDRALVDAVAQHLGGSVDPAAGRRRPPARASARCPTPST